MFLKCLKTSKKCVKNVSKMPLKMSLKHLKNVKKMSKNG